MIAALSWISKIYGVDIGIKLMFYGSFSMLLCSIPQFGIELMFNLIGYNWTFFFASILGVCSCIVMKNHF